MLNPYLEYLKDNPNNYWFKAKLYGWGWMPAKWQGWLVLLVYTAAVLFLAFRVEDNLTEENVLSEFILPLLGLTLILVLICYKTGESPKWQTALKKK